MNTQIYEEASDWIVRNRDGELSRHEKIAFDRWLRESPQHVRAYLEISSVWEGVSSLDAQANPDASMLIALARAGDNVVPLEAAATAPSRPARRSRLRLWYAAAASLLVLVASAWINSQANTYSTGIGEQRSILLADGTSIELNALSKLKVRYSDRERGVELIAGQALFRVAKEAKRAFVVETGGARVRAVGTQFDVYRKQSGGTVVTVIEGHVAVAGGAVTTEKQNAPVTLGAGEQVTLQLTQAEMKPVAAPMPRAADLEAVTAWTRRSLVFDSASLREVADEFNRYNRRQLSLQDANFADVHISGVFSSVDPTLLLRFLRAQPELKVEETDREIRISRRND